MKVVDTNNAMSPQENTWPEVLEWTESKYVHNNHRIAEGAIIQNANIPGLQRRMFVYEISDKWMPQ